MTRQIAISDEIYDQLNDIRHSSGTKFSFNTVIKTLIKQALMEVTDGELYRIMQWHAIQGALKEMSEKGWLPEYNLHYAHVVRLLANKAYAEASEYITEQLPKNSDIRTTTPT